MVATTPAAAALEYAQEFDWPVFPCHGKKPITRRGYKDATKDENQIIEFWTQNPNANIGVPTGAGSGFDVLDIDAGRGGLATLESLNGAIGDSPRTRTGGGGHHILFRHREGVSNRVDVLPGVDIRGDGGYVVMPPSVHPSGNLYEWLKDPQGALPDWPDELYGQVTRPAHELHNYGSKALDEECAKIRGAAFGQQEHQLTQSALKMGGLVAGGEVPFEEAFRALVAAGVLMPNQPGKPIWTQAEIEKKTTSGLVRGMQRPRSPHTPSKPPAAFDRTITVDDIKSPSELMASYGEYVDSLLTGRRFRLGFTALDDALRAVSPGEVITVIARSGVGKTAFLQNILLNTTNHNALFCSMEQPLAQCAERYIQMITGETGEYVEHQFSDAAQRAHVAAQVASMLGNTFTLGRSGLTLEDVSTAIDRASEKARAPIAVVALDYLGMLDTTGLGKGQYEGVSRAARAIKSLAKDKQVVVIVLCQVGRAAGEAGNWPLTLSSARDSGAIEESADYMLGLYRPHFNPVDLANHDDVIAIQILKNRKGFLGEFRYKFDRTSLRIRDEVQP